MPLIEASREDERHLQDIADAIAASHKVIVVTGAGISTSIGIPDFRSKDGLYSLIPEHGLPSPPPSEPATPTARRFASPAPTPSRKRKAIEIEDDEDTDEELPSSQNSRRSSISPNKRLRGQDLFHSRVFQDAASTTTFYRFIASLREKIHEVKDTSGTHKFLRTLRDGGRLIRCYTQNIDGLEAREGLVTNMKRGKGNKRRLMKKHYDAFRPEHTEGTDFDGGCEVVQLHGDLDTLRCFVCSTQWTWTENETELFMDGFAPRCKKCARKSDERQSTGKRGLAVGSLRPNIVLYGEDHPQNTLLSPFVPFDAKCQPDVLIIMGTSLKVFGLQKIIREFAKSVHNQKKAGKVIFVNRTRPAESVWDSVIDYFVPMDCDDWVADLKARRADIWMRQGELDLKVTKPKSSTAGKKRKTPSDIGTDSDTRPAKKVRVEVVIPPYKATASHELATKPAPGTPQHLRQSDYLRQRVLSPLMRAKRPVPSPLSKSFRVSTPSTNRNISVPVSPITPSYSPITPQVYHPSQLRTSVKVADKGEVEIQESDHEKENVPVEEPEIDIEEEEDSITVTPSKIRFEDRLADIGKENIHVAIRPTTEEGKERARAFIARAQRLGVRTPLAPLATIANTLRSVAGLR